MRNDQRHLPHEFARRSVGVQVAFQVQCAEPAWVAAVLAQRPVQIEERQPDLNQADERLPLFDRRAFAVFDVDPRYAVPGLALVAVVEAWCLLHF